MTQQYEEEKSKKQESLAKVNTVNLNLLEHLIPFLQENIVYPPSHSLSQTDREYFNIVKTEDGHSNFKRDKDG